MASAKSAETVGMFFDEQWKVYRDFIEHDLMHHKDLFAVLQEKILAYLPNDYSMLDLACGDSDPSSQLLKQLPALKYVGVDIAKAVLTLAEKNLKATKTPFVLLEQDFVEHLQKSDDAYDLILISFSLHPLETAEKQHFFELARKRLKPGGFLAVIDIIRFNGQGRSEWLAQCYPYMERRSQGKCQKSCETAHAHMQKADFPEEAQTYVAMAREAGFQSVELAYHHQESTFGVLIAGDELQPRSRQ